MPSIDISPSRITRNPAVVARRRAIELLVLAGAGLAFLFALGIAFGLVNG